MTEARYLRDTDTREFEARVERRLDDRVVLDETCFYPTGGGQPHDTGELVVAGGTGADGTTGRDAAGPETWRVVDVTKRDTIYHRLDADGGGSDLPPEGATVRGRVDWGRRSAHMRYHTAQHLLSGVLLSEFDAPTTGNQLYTDHARLDCAYPRFDEEDLETLERRLNALVDDALPVRWYELDRAEATLDPDRTRISLLPDSITEVRIVEIGPEDDPFDRTACAGTHVSNTEEVGPVRVTGRRTQGSEEERIEFVLGETGDGDGADGGDRNHGADVETERGR
ncbi:alanyl-tRNA editing protein [Halobium salinum]|uniref:Alanyl-tRNA editing protein n=1 Tax=Halobium salinum TaxID=1364940 RepID=A0ABD5PCY8_9EURY|nr:alanyl-tRNA editing protein [Halobium salinum]